MDRAELKSLVAHGEDMSLEFKRCGNQPGRDVFETICSFANRQGGIILLGVTDDGSIEGIDADRIVSIERNLINTLNNPTLFTPAPTVDIERVDLGIDQGAGRKVLKLWVPMGPSVYHFKGVVYDRQADVDIRLTSDARISALALRKQNLYTERRIYPWISTADLRLDLLSRVRGMTASVRLDHPWARMTDDELLRASRLIARNPQTGERGFTLAAVMILGSDDLISDVVPTYRTEALLRRIDIDRYDDRLTVQTNLIEAYDQLVRFCEKWLPDAFALDGMQRVSARDVIVRELVANSLMHREYSSPYMATLEIGASYIRTRNASRSLYSGPITPDNLDPTPKNPIIANFFMQIGRTERLGSGTRNLFKYSRLYTGQDPTLIDGDFFDAVVPVPDVAPRGSQLAGEVSAAVAASPVVGIGDESSDAIIAFVVRHGSCTSTEIAAGLGIPKRTLMRRLTELIDAGQIVRTGQGRGTRYSPA